jgi:hypothetical protein
MALGLKNGGATY